MMMEGIGLERGLSRRISSIGIAERRISEKVRTKEIGFISRRTSYRDYGWPNLLNVRATNDKA